MGSYALKIFGLHHELESDSGQLQVTASKLIHAVKLFVGYVIAVMTEPGTFKYLGSYPIKAAGKLFGYPWMTAWMAGLIVGAYRGYKNVYYKFLLLIIAYFCITSVIAVTHIAGFRHRVPAISAIALVSSFGWTQIYQKWRAWQANKKRRSQNP